MTNSRKLFFLLGTLFFAANSSFNLQAAVREFSPKPLDLTNEGRLFLPVYQAEVDFVRDLLAESTLDINEKIQNGVCARYTALRLAVAMWKGQFGPKYSDARYAAFRKSKFRDIAQLLVDHGANYSDDLGDFLRHPMGVKLTRRGTDSSPESMRTDDSPVAFTLDIERPDASPEADVEPVYPDVRRAQPLMPSLRSPVLPPLPSRNNPSSPEDSKK